MALDFPNSPTVGQLYPSPPSAGVPVWKWDGSEWVATANTGSTGYKQFEFTATAGQTVFSGADINGNTLAYSVNYAEVHVNGSLLNKADYTASNGTSITLAFGVNLNDQVTILALATTSTGNALLTSNNLSDVANAATSRNNLGAFGKVVKQVFTASGTYTPTANMLYCIIECIGGGGGAGGVVSAATTNIFGTGGGGSGGYSRTYASKATIGASQTVTIGGAGSGGSGATPASGTAGTATSVGALCIANGGAGSVYASNVQVSSGAAGATAGTGDLALPGNPGGNGWYTSGTASLAAWGGSGGAAYFGGAPAGSVGFSSAANGTSASGYGCGGSGASISGITGNAQGGNGMSGIVIITEFCSS